MAYVKTNWTDRLDTGSKYRITDNPDGTKAIEYAGQVNREGTPISAENMNHIEQGIFDATYMVLNVPVQNGTLTYTGDAVSPSWIGYDSTKMTISGDVSGTEVGEYTVVFTPVKPWMWNDGTVGAKEAVWRISDAVTIPVDDELSETSENPVKNKTVTAALLKFGAVLDTPAVNDRSIGYDGNEHSVVITGYDSDKIKISGTTSATEIGQYTVTFTPIYPWCWRDGSTAPRSVDWEILTIYGVEWDGSSPLLSSWTRTDTAAALADPVPYIASASSYSSPFDNLMPWSGMVIEERTGGTMVKIPKFWYRLTQTENDSIKIQIANQAADGFSVSPAHMDRGDGKGERDHVYVGRYHCCNDDYKSKTGCYPKYSVKRSDARTAVHNLGTNIWQADFAMRFTIWLLYLVEFADWNSQAKIGYGCGDDTREAKMGYTDSMPYHTGTTQASRDTYGSGTQYRYMEGLWDNAFDWVDGCYYNNDGLHIILNPARFNDRYNGVSVGTAINGGYPIKFEVRNASGAFPVFLPTETNATTPSGPSDMWSFLGKYPCVMTGGSFSQEERYGLFYMRYCAVDSYTDEFGTTKVGFRLMELP